MRMMQPIRWTKMVTPLIRPNDDVIHAKNSIIQSVMPSSTQQPHRLFSVHISPVHKSASHSFLPPPPSQCPLCFSSSPIHFSFHPPSKKGKNSPRNFLRQSYRCAANESSATDSSHCQLIFIPRQYHLTHDECRRRYDQHTNEYADEGYRKSLMKLIIPLVDQLRGANHTITSSLHSSSSQLVGLDFGCGPSPVMSQLIEKELGVEHCCMKHYDPIYHNERSANVKWESHSLNAMKHMSEHHLRHR